MFGRDGSFSVIRLGTFAAIIGVLLIIGAIVFFFIEDGTACRPDKLYIGSFERTSQFEAHLDETGVALTLLRPGGLLVTDNVLWDGEVVPGFIALPRRGEEDTRAIAEYNRRIFTHPQLLTSIVPLRDAKSSRSSRVPARAPCAGRPASLAPPLRAVLAVAGRVGEHGDLLVDVVTREQERTKYLARISFIELRC